MVEGSNGYIHKSLNLLIEIIFYPLDVKPFFSVYKKNTRPYFIVINGLVDKSEELEEELNSVR